MITLSLSQLAANLKPGIYKHFKGDEYELLCVGRLSEDRSKEFVVYKSLLYGDVWIRPLEMFLEIVDRRDYNYKGPRFVFLREKL